MVYASIQSGVSYNGRYHIFSAANFIRFDRKLQFTCSKIKINAIERIITGILSFAMREKKNKDR